MVSALQTVSVLYSFLPSLLSLCFSLKPRFCGRSFSDALPVSLVHLVPAMAVFSSFHTLPYLWLFRHHILYGHSFTLSMSSNVMEGILKSQLYSLDGCFDRYCHFCSGQSVLIPEIAPLLPRPYLPPHDHPIFLRVCHSQWRFLNQKALSIVRIAIAVYLTTILALSLLVHSLRFLFPQTCHFASLIPHICLSETHSKVLA